MITKICTLFRFKASKENKIKIENITGNTIQGFWQVGNEVFSAFEKITEQQIT